MAKPFKFRYINRITGAFLFGTVVILAIIATLGAKSQQWFAKVAIYKVEIPVGSSNDEESGGTMGIKAGSDVRVLGNQVGHVKSVSLCTGDDLTPIKSFENVEPGSLRIVAFLSVRGEFSNFIGEDSTAILKYDLGGLGAPYFDISRGTTRFLNDVADVNGVRRLAFAKEPDAKGEVFEIVERLEKEMIPAIQRYKETAETATVAATAATKFIEDLSNKDEVLYRSLGSLETGIADLNKFLKQAAAGDGALGDMVSADSKMRKELNEFAVTLNSGTENLKAAIDNLDEGITELRVTGIASINKTAESLPATVNQTRATIAEYDAAAKQMFETLREIEILTEGLQKHWLVRNRIEDPIEDPKEEKSTSSKSKTREAQTRPSSRIFKRR